MYRFKHQQMKERFPDKMCVVLAEGHYLTYDDDAFTIARELGFCFGDIGEEIEYDIRDFNSEIMREVIRNYNGVVIEHEADIPF